MCGLLNWVLPLVEFVYWHKLMYHRNTKYPAGLDILINLTGSILVSADLLSREDCNPLLWAVCLVAAGGGDYCRGCSKVYLLRALINALERG
jgi:hypothetical protein